MSKKISVSDYGLKFESLEKSYSSHEDLMPESVDVGLNPCQDEMFCSRALSSAVDDTMGLDDSLLHRN